MSDAGPDMSRSRCKLGSCLLKTITVQSVGRTANLCKRENVREHGAVWTAACTSAMWPSNMLVRHLAGTKVKVQKVQRAKRGKLGGILRQQVPSYDDSTCGQETVT